MKSNSLSTILTTLAITVMTFFVLTSMQRSHAALYAGIVLVSCLLTFAIILSVDATKQKRKGYINL